jgi:hypothetical protein
VRRGQEVSFTPQLSYTKDYVKGKLTDRLRPLERKIESESRLGRNDIDAMESLRSDIRQASYSFPDLERRTGNLLDTARTLFEEQQREAVYNRFARELTEVAGLLEDGANIEGGDVEDARRLKNEITEASYSFPDLVDRATGITEAMTKKYEKQLQEEAYDRFRKELADAQDLLAEEHRVTDRDINRVKTLASDINNARFRFPELIARSSGLVKKVEKKQKLDGLTAQQQKLQFQLQKSIKAKKGKTVGGFVSLGLGVVGGGLAGLFMYLAEESYNEYMDATLTSQAVTYREEFETYDILSYISIGAGGVGISLSTILFATRPKPDEYRERLDNIERQITTLKGAE